MNCCICKSEIKQNILSSPSKCLDGYICDKCSGKIPSLVNKKELPSFKLLSWINMYPEDEFVETSSFGSIYLDELHGLFRIQTSKKDISNTFKLLDLSAVSFTLKNTVNRDNVIYSDIAFSFEIKKMSFSKTVIVKKNARCESKRVDSTHLSYSEPSVLTVFRQVFNQAIENQLNSITLRLKELGVTSFNDIDKAKALFMVDELDEAEIKKIRNVLIKAFHPDNSNLDKKYTERINKAYTLLMSEING